MFLEGIFLSFFKRYGEDFVDMLDVLHVERVATARWVDGKDQSPQPPGGSAITRFLLGRHPIPSHPISAWHLICRLGN